MPETRELAGGKNFAAVTTVLPSGRLQTQLVWVDVADGKILLNTETHRRKYRNVRRDPRITVVIRDEQDPYRYAEIRGHVSDTVTGDRARAQIDELAHKYIEGPYPPDAIKSERVIVLVTAERQTFIDQNAGVAD
ncbi:PPOX class F420-dependent oxidoreductase [Amycolatopsis sp. CA-230715]|uniref:PPOX class F420-dependent oxidoreductase n=1 Tax=Amycolatopsis sp. CA-230715 TaxID=2745196 RepID=UPI001C333B31|nr:PPOX class F420-dependent oxidoreductase [Amycolatopsis sp. CA-230715]QWF84743.1 hypothetical protein HUW46_08195 [Amycolatopsis sp. CA-230715]